MVSSRLNVLHLITSLGGGGTENFLFQIASHAPPDVATSIVTLHKGGVIAERLEREGLSIRTARSPWQINHLLQELKPDIVHTCLFWGNQLGRWLGKRQGLRVVSSQRATAVWERPWHAWLDKQTLPSCDGVIVNSLAAQVLIEKRLEGTSKHPKMARIPNGLDFDRFTLRARQAARKQFGLADNAVVGGTLGRLHYEKGGEKIPALADAILRNHPDRVLLVAGVGPLEGRLKRATQKWGPQVRFVGWQEDSVTFLSALDYFWLLSREESFPQALLEASGMGLPWIAPDVGDIRELQRTGAVGTLVPVNDLRATAQACENTMAHLSSLTAKASLGRAALVAHYSLPQMIRTFYAFLDQIV